MNINLQQGSDRLARVIQPNWPPDTPHRLTEPISSDVGVAGLVDFVQRSIRGNAPRRLARAVLRDWIRGGDPKPTGSLSDNLLKEMEVLREEVEQLKTQIAERRYWELQERYPMGEAVSKMSKEDLARLPKDLTKVKKDKPHG